MCKMGSIDSVAVSMNNRQVERKQTGGKMYLSGHHDCSGKRKESGASQRPAFPFVCMLSCSVVCDSLQPHGL